MVVSDGLRSYPAALTGYVHELVNVKATGQPAHVSLPAVHRLFAQVKKTLEGTYQDSQGAGHLQEYLDEYVFRFNRRRSHSRGLVFLRLLERVVSAAPATYNSLIRTSEPKLAHPAGLTGHRARPGTLNLPPANRPWRRT